MSAMSEEAEKKVFKAYISNIAPLFSEDHLNSILSTFGTVSIESFGEESVESGTKQCVAVFEEESQVNAAICLNGHDIGGSSLNIVMYDEDIHDTLLGILGKGDVDKVESIGALKAKAALAMLEEGGSNNDQVSVIQSENTDSFNAAVASWSPSRVSGEKSENGGDIKMKSNVGLSDQERIQRTIYVGGIDETIDEQQLRDIFKHCGDIDYVKMASFDIDGVVSYCSFVEFYETEAVAKAFMLQGYMLKHCRLRIGNSNKRIIRPQKRSKEEIIAKLMELKESMELRFKEKRSNMSAGNQENVLVGSRSSRSSSPGAVKRAIARSRSPSTRRYKRSKYPNKKDGMYYDGFIWRPKEEETENEK